MHSPRSIGTNLAPCPWQRQFELLFFLQTVTVPDEQQSQHSLKWTWHEKYTFSKHWCCLGGGKKMTFYFCFSPQYRQYIIPHITVLVRNFVLPEARDKISRPPRGEKPHAFTPGVWECVKNKLYLWTVLPCQTIAIVKHILYYLIRFWVFRK